MWRSQQEREPLDLEVWLSLYRQICAEFGYDPEADAECARELSALLGAKSADSLEIVRRRVPRSVTICGTSESLPDELRKSGTSGYVVAADGATTALMAAGKVPDMIVTDLDGTIDDQVEANRNGAAVFVHAHGDNRGAIRGHAQRFSKPVVATCQGLPQNDVFNFGGFTDGDRAACICAALGAREIRLVGFDFERPAAKPGKDLGIKRRKLVWAKKIIELLESEGVGFVFAPLVP